MKKRYYAYFGKDQEWCVKPYPSDEFFLDRVKEALRPQSLLAGYLLPWVTDVTRKESNITPMSDPQHPAWQAFFKIMPHATVWWNKLDR